MTFWGNSNSWAAGGTGVGNPVSQLTPTIPTTPSTATATTSPSTVEQPLSLSSGLIVVTEASELRIISSKEAIKHHFTTRITSKNSIIGGGDNLHAKISGIKVPVLPSADNTTIFDPMSLRKNNEDYLPESLSNAVGSIATPFSLLSSNIDSQKGGKIWLSGLFDANTGNIPAISSVYDSFLDGLAVKKRDDISLMSSDVVDEMADVVDDGAMLGENRQKSINKRGNSIDDDDRDNDGDEDGGVGENNDEWWQALERKSTQDKKGDKKGDISSKQHTSQSLDTDTKFSVQNKKSRKDNNELGQGQHMFTGN